MPSENFREIASNLHRGRIGNLRFAGIRHPWSQEKNDRHPLLKKTLELGHRVSTEFCLMLRGVVAEDLE